MRFRFFRKLHIVWFDYSRQIIRNIRGFGKYEAKKHLDKPVEYMIYYIFTWLLIINVLSTGIIRAYFFISRAPHPVIKDDYPLKICLRCVYTNCYGQ